MHQAFGDGRGKGWKGNLQANQACQRASRNSAKAQLCIGRHRRQLAIMAWDRRRSKSRERDLFKWSLRIVHSKLMPSHIRGGTLLILGWSHVYSPFWTNIPRQGELCGNLPFQVYNLRRQESWGWGEFAKFWRELSAPFQNEKGILVTDILQIFVIFRTVDSTAIQ